MLNVIYNETCQRVIITFININFQNGRNIEERDVNDDEEGAKEKPAIPDENRPFTSE